MGIGNCAISDISATLAANMYSGIRSDLRGPVAICKMLNGDTGRVTFLPLHDNFGPQSVKAVAFLYLDAPIVASRDGPMRKFLQRCGILQRIEARPFAFDKGHTLSSTRRR